MSAEATRKRRRGRALWTAAGLGLMLAATVPTAWAATVPEGRPPGDPATAPQYARFYGQQPAWGECERASAAVRCARVTVPVDWSRPEGSSIEIVVALRKGNGRGTLMLNPGGPGLSGVSFIVNNEAALSGYGLEGYDLVSWDPRGVGGSAPLTCPQGATAAIERVDSSPDTTAEAEVFDAAVSRWAQACRSASGPVFAHMDTDSTARDMDVLRAVVGQPKLNFLGISYGTIMGGRYAELFPARVGRMILDSAGHPDNTYRSWMAGVAEAKELSLDNYLAGCATRPECPFTSMSREEARDWIQQALRDTDHRPLRFEDNTVRQAQFAAVLTRDVDPRQDGWFRLDAELGALRAGSAEVVAMTAPQRTIDIQNVATTCQDLAEHRTASEVLRDAKRTSRTAPVFGAEITAGSFCTHWPARKPASPHRLHAAGVPPILVVGITQDTAGPFRWSGELVAQLGNARLLTLDGVGHGAYLIDQCVRDRVNTFLADGVLPPLATVCP